MSSDCSDDESDSEEALFMKRVKKEFSRQKKKMPLKCFNYGKTGHFAAKCPYENDEDNVNEKKSRSYKKKFRGKDKKFWKSKKSLYSKKESDSSEGSEEESLSDEILFMSLQKSQGENQVDENVFDEEDGEVDLEQELISALSEIKSLKKKNLNLKMLLKEETKEKDRKSQALEDAEKQIKDLKFQIEDANKLEVELRNQIRVKAESKKLKLR